jgi:hypothetical protein
MMTERITLYRLVDMLPERDLDAARRMQHGLLSSEEDPVLRAFAEAPAGTEEMSADDLVALARGDADVVAGRVVSHKEAKRVLFGDE